MQTALRSTPNPRPYPFQRPELLAPAGNWECAKAAVENGADAIYFGLDRFNARMRAQNFTEADLPDLMSFLHRRGVKGYVTVNTLVFAGELADAEQYLRSVIAAGVDAVIVQDIGLCRLIRHLSSDFPIHASTQMTITSAAGVAFAKELGCHLVVLARECSLQEIEKIQQQLGNQDIALPLEVFVHGALCVAYSGQCLTSEALGGRSANRGECAQACRMPYDLFADGEQVDLGDRRYLLSPQDLSGLEVLPELVKSGVASLKIEGRLKAPEYVANVTRVYRAALDRVMDALSLDDSLQNTQVNGTAIATQNDQYNLEMAFSRGLYTGWFRGINNQELVHARFGKKRGVYLGEVTQVRNDQVYVKLEAPVKAGDGVVFDNGRPDQAEEGGRIYAVETRGQVTVLTFGRNAVNWRRVNVGDRLWKTSDPELDRELRQTYAGDTPKFQRPIWVEIHGALGETLVAIARDELGNIARVESGMILVAAHNQPLTPARLHAQFSRLGNTPFRLETLTSHLQGNLMLPVSELNRLRRELVSLLEERRSLPKRWTLNAEVNYQSLLPSMIHANPSDGSAPSVNSCNLITLTRRLAQLQAALEAGITTLYCEFEDPRRYKDAVQIVKNWRATHPSAASPQIFVAPPRITKPGETWILQQVRSSNADGYLIRNYDHLQFFADQRCIGDFSLNIANPITANYFRTTFRLERLTTSYDLNIQQLTDLIQQTPPHWLEITIHQHMPMFHMEHCVFCAFLSEGIDYRNCGRPCETKQVTLGDRTGTQHILQADAGCRNTVFNGTAQTGAEYVQHLITLGIRHFRIEFVNDSGDRVKHIIQKYQQLLAGEITGTQLWRDLKLFNQLGVTRGTLG